MRAAFHSVGLADRSVDEAIETVARHGYDAIELNAETLPWAQPHVVPETDAETRRRIVQQTRDLGLGISAISAHVSLVEPETAARADAVAFTRGCIDLACDLGVGVVHGLSGPPPDGIPSNEAWGWLVAVVGECGDYANARGVRYAFEAIANHLVARVADLEQLIRAVGRERLWVNFDPSHFEVMGDDPVTAARALAPRVVHAHLKDARRVPEDFAFPPLGDGMIDFGAVVKELAGGGYDGYLSAEYEAQVYGYDLPVEQVLDDSLAFARRLIDQTAGRRGGIASQNDAAEGARDR